jgi:hypothetical protein
MQGVALRFQTEPSSPSPANPGHHPSQTPRVLVISLLGTPGDNGCKADTIARKAHRVACSNRRVLNRAEGETERLPFHPVLK